MHQLFGVVPPRRELHGEEDGVVDSGVMRQLRANEPDLRNAAKASTQEVARLETALAGSEQTVGELQLSLEAALGEANRLLEDLTRALAEAELNRLRATPSAQVLDQLRAENARLRNKLDVEREESQQLRELNARRVEESKRLESIKRLLEVKARCYR